MSDDFERRPFSQEKDPLWNREPGLAVVPGSNLQKEYAKFEQFPYSKWAFGEAGNPYEYRPYPKMMYKAQRYEGRIACNAAPPRRRDFRDDSDWSMAIEEANRFDTSCQLTVTNETERSRAWENGYRDSPVEAVEAMQARDRAIADAAAHRNYEDRNMSEPAKREIAAAQAAVGGEHVPVIPEKKRRGRPRKVQPVA